MTVDSYRLVEVESFPRPLDAGILYFSQRFSTAAHACACGCGREVITPISPVQWRLTRGIEGVSLRPSIGNWNFPCRSHYWITDGGVDWAGDMKDEDIKAGRAFNAKLRERYFESKNAAQRPSPPPPPVLAPERKRGLIKRLIEWLASRLR